MKKATLEATDENILQSIKEQKGTERNTEIMEFIKALDLIEENIFISLDEFLSGKHIKTVEDIMKEE